MRRKIWQQAVEPNPKICYYFFGPRNQPKDFCFRKLKCGNISFQNGCETMGFYLNPPADGFESLRKTGLYVDKTELIAYTNQVLGTDRKLICVSRPRRFGKTSLPRCWKPIIPKGRIPESCSKDLK